MSIDTTTENEFFRSLWWKSTATTEWRVRYTNQLKRRSANERAKFKNWKTTEARNEAMNSSPISDEAQNSAAEEKEKKERKEEINKRGKENSEMKQT
jgi:hypothetical protein